MSFNKSLLLLSALLSFFGSVRLSGAELETDPTTGLVKAENWELVVANCTACHSAKGFTQIRFDRNNWQQAIKRMQATQGLWPLGDMEKKVLDYLSANYGLSDQPHNPKIRKPIEP